MSFQIFKHLFNSDANDQGTKEVVLKVFDPEILKGSCSGKPYVFDNFLKQIFRSYSNEVKSYTRIENYNKGARFKTRRVNVPKLLDHGSLVIFNEEDYVWHIGYYIIFSKIQSTREFMRKDIRKLRKQVKLLNENVLIQHAHLSESNMIVSKNDVYLIDFASSYDLQPNSSFESLDSLYCERIYRRRGRKPAQKKLDQ